MDVDFDWVKSITVTNSYNNSAVIAGNDNICNIPNQVEWYYTDISGTTITACTTYITITAPDYESCCISAVQSAQKPAHLTLPDLNRIKIENDGQPRFTVYPNPAHGAVNLNLHGFNKTAEIKLYDHLGRKIKQINLQGGTPSLKLDMSELNTSSGLYLISIEMEGKVYSKKLMISK